MPRRNREKAGRGSTAVRLPALAVLSLLALAGCASPDATDADVDGLAGDEAVAPEGAILSGQATATAPAQLAFQVGPGHERLAVAIVMATALPGTLTLNVTGPDGRTDQVSTSPFLYVFPGTRSTVSFAEPTPGDWAVRVQVGGNGAVADYEVHWCADSAANPGSQDNVACQRKY